MSDNKTPKKKFQLDGFSTMFLAALLFIVGQETGNAGKLTEGINPDKVISIICYIAAVLVFLSALRKVWNNRKAQIIAHLEAEEQAAREAAEAEALEAEDEFDDLEDAGEEEADLEEEEPEETE